MGLLDHFIKHYLFVILIFILSCCTYLCCIHLIIYPLNCRKLLFWLKNLLPPGLVALSCTSSLAALPFNLKSIANNLDQRPTPFAHAILPIATNLHTLGNCFFDTIIVFSILKVFHMPLLEFSMAIIYALRLLFMKFSNAAVPSVGLIILIPIVEEFYTLRLKCYRYLQRSLLFVTL